MTYFYLSFLSINMAAHNDQKYINALLNNDSMLVEEIYKKCSLQCKKFIQNNGGTLSDAEDIFQNTIIYVYHKAKSALKKGSELILTAPICAYLYPIYKGRWYNELKIRKRILRNKAKGGYTDIESYSVEMRLIQEKAEKIFMECFNKQPSDYKELYKLRYKENKSSKEIAAQLNIEHNTVDQRLYYYKEKLKRCAQQHPDFKDLKL